MSAVGPHVEAAAVLAAFDPLTLRPVGADTHDGLPAGFLPLCEPLAGPRTGLWRLQLVERRAALRGLVARGALHEALTANEPRPDLPLQQMFERVVTAPDGLPDDPAALAALLSRPQLAALYHLHDWLDGILDVLPDHSAVERALDRFDLLAPLRRLTRTGFVGRAEELAELGRFVLDSDRPGPLFVHGPGGAGKSTLVARFALDQVAELDAPDGLVVAYVDLDRPTARPDRPGTLLIHAVAQLAPQLRLPPELVESFASEVVFTTTRVEHERWLESARSSRRESLVGLFVRMIGPALGTRRVLLVVDAFEEVSALGEDMARTALAFLTELGRDLPNLRLVVSSRDLPAGATDPDAIDPDAIDPGAIDLGLLDPEQARVLLRRALDGSGSPAPPTDELDAVLDAVLEVVGRTAVCVRLAARLLVEEGVAAFDGARELSGRPTAVAAWLYGRIAAHLPSADARRIAWPGLLVRRITPEVVAEVLADPCWLELGPDHDEHAVVAELRAAAALVEVGADGALRHRPDLRRALLGEHVAGHVPPEVAARVDRAAVAFHRAGAGVGARTEELYHLLRLGEPEQVLESRWVPEAAPGLRDVGDELAAPQRLWLAGKLGVTLDPPVRAAADLPTWERQAAASVERYLLASDGRRALQVLAERTERSPGSPLHALESDAYRLLGDLDAALAAARRGVDAAAAAGAADLAATHLLQMVVIEEGRGHLDAAWALVTEARDAGASGSDPVLRLRTDVTRRRLARRRGAVSTGATGATGAERLGPELVDALRSRPVLLREVAAELGGHDPVLSAAAVETLGVEVADDAQATAFGHVITRAGDPDGGTDLGATFALGAQLFADGGADDVRAWVDEVVTARDTRRLARGVAALADGDPVLTALQDYFRAGVDASLRPVATGSPTRRGT